MSTIKEPHRRKRDSAAGSDKHSKKDSGKKRKPKRKISDLDIEEKIPAGSLNRKNRKNSKVPEGPPAIVGKSTGEKEEGGGNATKPAHRFIVFIGNLPYTTTHPQLQSHFSSLQPSSIRLITGKTPPHTCKGFAFLEFTSYDRMKSCLAKYHHSMFLDRKINVELTAGGGGAKSKGRREKLRAKNERLSDQRKRRIEGEEKLKGEKRAERAAEGEGGSEGGIHPSRRRNVKA
ncbi:hypothetical protein C7212DRAFT_349901 [Tuber magnatum]|uniref:RRM domain-containing protein n=1 Tax=Tuber magnatum TaxID=42249 RepID=A0A317T3H3_9PEZI|nr:hypothetical protein C7212DRAFT_349901 [Tuber magnatum]